MNTHPTPMKITCEIGYSDAWICICGNQPHTDGFYPCDTAGNEIEPDHCWDGIRYVCARCNRIIDQNTLEILNPMPTPRATGNAAHTPTPLYIETSPTGCHYLKNAQGRVVASFHSTEDGKDNAARRAEDAEFRAFIVRACNEYDSDKAKIAALDNDHRKVSYALNEANEKIAALVEALEAYIAWHEGKCGSLSSSDKLREAKTQARAALARLEDAP